MDNLAAKDTEGTFLGKPGELGLQPAYRLRGRYSDRTNTAGIGSQHVQESLDRHGDAVQHVTYWLDDADYDAAAAHLESSGYREIQSFRLPILRLGYFDTRRAIGVVTEIVGAKKEGHELRRNLKSGNF
jgi:hypothetical protein